LGQVNIPDEKTVQPHSIFDPWRNRTIRSALKNEQIFIPLLPLPAPRAAHRASELTASA
jgi:hypothetical protein